MSHGEFIPLGDERLAQSQSSGFVRVTRPGMVDEDVIEPAQPVSPAEDNDLSSRIRQILQPHVQGTTLDQALAEIQTAVDAAPARMALPEIKLTPVRQPTLTPKAKPRRPPSNSNATTTPFPASKSIAAAGKPSRWTACTRSKPAISGIHPALFVPDTCDVSAGTERWI